MTRQETASLGSLCMLEVSVVALTTAGASAAIYRGGASGWRRKGGLMTSHIFITPLLTRFRSVGEVSGVARFEKKTTKAGRMAARFDPPKPPPPNKGKGCALVLETITSECQKRPLPVTFCHVSASAKARRGRGGARTAEEPLIVLRPTFPLML